MWHTWSADACFPQNQFKAHAHDFCTFDDYNWDLSLVSLWGRGLIPKRMVVLPRARVDVLLCPLPPASVRKCVGGGG